MRPTPSLIAALLLCACLAACSTEAATIPPTPADSTAGLSAPSPTPATLIVLPTPSAARTATPQPSPTAVRIKDPKVTPALAGQESPPTRVKPGIEVLVEEQPELIAGKRVGLITNPTGVDSKLRSDVDLIGSVPGTKLVALFAGEHGLRGAEPAGKKLQGTTDPYIGVPVYSLYGSTLRPRPEWLSGIDVLIFDIQNSGSAYYTYKFTMSFAMEEAARAGIPFIVLDRPNPAGGEMVEGPMVPARNIWRHPLPLRHGMTNGELALMWNEEYRIEADLTVVKMKGWRRDMTWEETGLPWVAPSPNIPTADTALAYAGQALIESIGNLSEGRGTTKPFLVTGAPWVDAVKAAAELNSRGLPGVVFRPAYFQPSKPGEKFNGQMCGGVEIHFTERRDYQAVETTLHILEAYQKTALRPVTISATGPIRGLGSGGSVRSYVDGYQAQIEGFLKVRQKYLLY